MLCSSSLMLRLTGDRLDLLAEDDADADAGADRTKAGADAEGDRLAGGFDPFVRDRGEWGTGPFEVALLF